jgi:hypothetical protein
MPNEDDFEFKQQMIVIVDLMKQNNPGATNKYKNAYNALTYNVNEESTEVKKQNLLIEDVEK